MYLNALPRFPVRKLVSTFLKLSKTYLRASQEFRIILLCNTTPAQRWTECLEYSKHKASHSYIHQFLLHTFPWAITAAHLPLIHSVVLLFAMYVTLLSFSLQRFFLILHFSNLK